MTHLGPLSPENRSTTPRCPVRDLGSPKQERAAPWTSPSSPRGLSGSKPSVWGMGVLYRKSEAKSGSLLWAQVPSRGLAHNRSGRPHSLLACTLEGMPSPRSTKGDRRKVQGLPV